LQRGQHNIDDELIFMNHDGYIFHDSRGFEAGGKGELKTVQKFVKCKSQEKRLKDRLHAIWLVISFFCVSTVVNSQGHGYFSGIASRWTMIGHR